MAGGHETAKPDDVHKKIRELPDLYNGIGKIRRVTPDDIIAFHAEFESIHPFQDGNGRVGRLVALKECLHYNIVPFIIEERKKAFYYRGLANWREEKGWLTDTCLDGQDTFKALPDATGVPYDKTE